MGHRYGVSDAEERIKALRCVWVSHMHADHHGGLYRLLELRARLMGREATPLLIIGPWPLFSVLTSYQRAVRVCMCAGCTHLQGVRRGVMFHGLVGARVEVPTSALRCVISVVCFVLCMCYACVPAQAASYCVGLGPA